MGPDTEIRRRIRRQGKITFAEFMKVALFWQPGGYYSHPGNFGPGGDYYTAPGTHPAFGALLSLQTFQMWKLLDCPSPFWLVEMGAGGGHLCHDLIAYSVHLPQPFQDSLKYLCLDRTPSHGVEKVLPSGITTRIDRLAAQGIPLHGLTGCFLSNELVDCFPVHRVVVQGGALKEIYLTLKDGNLVEAPDSPSTPALEQRLDSLGLSLPKGCRAEINLGIDPWMDEVSHALTRGFLLTVDYGHLAEELYSHRRRQGTLACFYRHTQTNDPYIRIGTQDLTAHVDFTSLMKLGSERGLEPLGLATQREFLYNLGLGRFMARLPTAGLGQRELEANRFGMLEIGRPGGMGDFKVLIQGKGVGSPNLWGFGKSDEVEALVEQGPTPLLTALHMPILDGRYSQPAFDWEGLVENY